MMWAFLMGVCLGAVVFFPIGIALAIREHTREEHERIRIAQRYGGHQRW